MEKPRKEIMKVKAMDFCCTRTILALACLFAATANAQSNAFYDDFSSGTVDPTKWYAANKNWGGKVDKWSSEDYNGGVVPSNLFVKNGILQCVAHGNLYEGDILGIAKDGKQRKDGKRVGACAVTRDYFASGSYEIRAKVAPATGVCCTMWTFEYEELYPGDPGFQGSGEYYVVNHEIDIEMPGRPGSAHTNIGYDYALCNTWVGEKGNEYTASHMKLPQRQDDGNFHTYRFDWHTGDKAGTITPRVEFYFDGVPVVTNYTHIPTKAGRLWVGAWFPKGWAGTPDFDTSVFEVDYVKITPFNEENDEPANETYGTDGLSEPLNIDLHSVWDVGSPVASSVKAHINFNGELVFSGAGAVSNFASAADAPWAAYAAVITGAKVADGVVFGKGSQTGLSKLACVNGIPLALHNGDVTEEAWGVFYDDFTSGAVDPTKWYAANKNWGGDIDLDGLGQNYNGGVVPANLYVRNNILQCEAHGSLYEGNVIGITKGGKPRPDGKRVGACAVTRDYFASGRYEIRAKVAPAKGVCCTMWTFEYEEIYDKNDPEFQGSGSYYVVNHEIDIEMPGRPSSANKDISYEYALCNTWIGEKGSEYTASHMKLPQRQDDGNFHTYRFDWHSGSEDGTIRPRVEFYFDGVLVQINYTHIPFKAGRFWVGAWFPRGWAGTPNFDTSVFEVDWVKITPYHEENDRPQHETYGTDGLAEPLNIVPPPIWEVGSPVASDVIARLGSDGVLVFNGCGPVTNFASAADAPWASQASSITDVVIYDTWNTTGPFFVESRNWVQYWEYGHLDGNLELAPGSLAGLDNLSKLNGIPLTTFSQVANSVNPSGAVQFRVAPTSISVNPGAKTANLSMALFKSPDSIHWTPVNSKMTVGSEGKAPKIQVHVSSAE